MRLFVLAAALAGLAFPITAQETRSFTDHLGRTVEIPVNPQRIASLHDWSVTTALLELGAPPVASAGGTNAEGVPFIRSSKILNGYDFDNTDITFLGGWPFDIEAIAAVEPDLIITIPARSEIVDQLELIAPTIVLNNLLGLQNYEFLAELTGTTDRLAVLEGRYAEQIAQMKRLIEAENISVNHIIAGDGQFTVWHTYQALGKVLRDVGFRFPDGVEAIEEGKSASFSAESLPEFDADFLFVTYRTDSLETPAHQIAALEALMPGYCDFLHACRNNQMIFLPREEAASLSYNALSLMTYTILSHISGRNFVPLGADR